MLRLSQSYTSVLSTLYERNNMITEMNWDARGITYEEGDRDNGPFRIRVGGSNDFVSKINPDDPRCVPPGDVEYVTGLDNDQALEFDELDDALCAAADVFAIDGVHTTIEALGD